MGLAVHQPAVRTPQRISLAEALALGTEAWDGLVAGAQSPSPFMSWAWHRAWANSAPAFEVAETEVFTLRGADGSLRALLPLRLQRIPFRRVSVRALTWAMGDIGCPDELDIPASPDTDWAAVAAAFDVLPWQVVILSNLAERASNAERLCAALESRGHIARHYPLWICPRLALPPTWDAYLASLSANRRQILRRRERALRRNHAVTLTDYPEGRVEEGWAHLMLLHQRRWNGAGGGAFQDPRCEQLQLHFAREMAKQQRLWLSTLDVDGQPAAAWYGFTAGDAVHYYQSGRDPRWKQASVGQVLMGMMIQRAIARGFRAFHFLRGDDRYKRQWTTDRHRTREVVIFRSGWGGRWLRALDAMAELRGKVASRRE
ncbi:MAG TPA: GNAT family N-acetyltransferase [Gemmatimonadales bacterium]|nr:GNAT family N-acetyltransferase [Gemmatimonadales bacterium]